MAREVGAGGEHLGRGGQERVPSRPNCCALHAVAACPAGHHPACVACQSLIPTHLMICVQAGLAEGVQPLQPARGTHTRHTHVSCCTMVSWKPDRYKHSCVARSVAARCCQLRRLRAHPPPCIMHPPYKRHAPCINHASTDYDRSAHLRAHHAHNGSRDAGDRRQLAEEDGGAQEAHGLHGLEGAETRRGEARRRGAG